MEQATEATPRKSLGHGSGIGVLVISLALSAAVAGATLQYAHWPRQRAFMLGIFVLAALLWVAEALPLFATAILVVALQVILLANPAGWPGLGFEGEPGPTMHGILASATDPVLVLFFGGFLLARAAVKEGVDSAMAGLILRPFGARPARVLLGVMLVTALFSMWMSNTATAAMMLALLTPMLASLPAQERFRKGLVLAVPFAANIGGMGTPIGTPPNAVAVGFLRAQGISLDFFGWMLIAVPLMLTMLLAAWALLWVLYRPHARDIRLQPTHRPLTRRSLYVVFIFVLTVLLWLSEPWHGLPAAAVAMLPAVAFTAPGVLTHHDVNHLDWNILILIAGGISLGAGVQATQLDQVVASLLAVNVAGSPLLLMALLVVATLLLSTFMSNTAAANLLLPIAIAYAVARKDAAGFLPVQFALGIALSASLAMALPISTPPNALACAGGEVNSRDMALPGALIGVVGGFLIVLATGLLVRVWGG
ncbi:MAG: DASS family sodium-coupled anion symporter [Phycisphaerae bacterium]|nr:DASS family sodium-coupled anion symporter [Phycisphaerae bacterium]MDW8261525.1 DASS family sodium-coupled anion symporter [Phycisphaerales bacterium]